MKALITGGAGFIGSHLAEALVDGGNAVLVVDDLSTGNEANIAHLTGSRYFSFIRQNVIDATAMEPLVAECECVFHLAAAVGVQLIVDHPVCTLETNIHGSETILKLAARLGKKVVLASSSEVYGKNTATPFNEDDDTTLGPTRFTRWSYACSKMIDEFLALAYHEEFGLETVICRLFNTIGPRQTGKYGMVAPRFVQAALASEPIEIYGTGKQSRCFCNVTDIVGALIDLANCPQAVGQVVNIGTDEPVSIEYLADRVISLTGSTSQKSMLTYEQAYGRAVDDMLVRVPDLTKIKQLTGFEPKYSLDETLLQIIDYLKRGK